MLRVSFQLGNYLAKYFYSIYSYEVINCFFLLFSSPPDNNFDIRQSAGNCQSDNKGDCFGDGEVCCANVKKVYQCVEENQCLEWVF